MDIANQIAAQVSELLSEGVKKFRYKKTDGTERVAFGTRNLAIVSQQNGPAMPSRFKTPGPDCVGYFDFVKKQWRSFKPMNFIGFDDYE